MPKVKDSKFLFKRKSGMNELDSPDTVKVMQDELIETIDLEEDGISKDTSMPYVDKDQESDEFNSVNLGKEASKIMGTIASDMGKAFSSKKRDIEMFTESMIEINKSYMNRILNSHKNNKDLFEDFCPKFIGVVDQIAEDLVLQKEREDKLRKIFQHQINVIEHQRMSNLRKLGHLKVLCNTLEKELDNRKSKRDEEIDYAFQELKQEILLMQKRKLMEIQQKEMKNMRRSLQSLFYA